MAGYVGVNSKSQELVGGWIGVNGKARRIINGWVGVNGKARRIWGTNVTKHLIQVFDQAYENQQTYNLSKASMTDTIRYAIAEWVYLDRFANTFDVALKEKTLREIENIVAYATTVKSDADYVQVALFQSSSNPITFRVNVSLANVDASAAKINSAEAAAYNSGWRREHTSITNLTVTNSTGFSVFITADNVTYSSSSGWASFLGAGYTTSSNRSLNVKNIGVHFDQRIEDEYIAKWDFINGTAYDEVDQTFIELGAGYSLLVDSNGVKLRNRFRGKIVLPCYYSLRGLTYEVDWGDLSYGDGTVGGDSRMFVIPCTSNQWAGLFWHKANSCYALYDYSSGYHDTSITNFDYFANSTLKVEISSSGLWKVYKNDTLIISAILDDKYLYQSCMELGNTNSYNNYNAYIRGIRIIEPT